MKAAKYAKYLLIVGLLAALLISPRTVAKVAASGAEIESMYAEAESPLHKSVAGTKTQMEGFYLVNKVDGVALIPTAGQPAGAYVKVMDTDKDASKAAVAVATQAAAGLGGTVGPCINVDYGKIVKEEFVETTEGSQGILYIGIPGDFRQDGARYAVAAVYSGGGCRVYENSSTNPIAVAVTVDQAMSAKVMYALIKY